METGLLQLTLIDCYIRLCLVWHGLVYTRIGYKGVSPEKPSMPKKACRKRSNHTESQTTTKALCLKCKAIYNVLHLFSKRRVNCVHGKPKKILSQITQACHFASRWCFDWPDSHRKCKSTRLLVRRLALPHPPMLYIPCLKDWLSWYEITPPILTFERRNHALGICYPIPFPFRPIKQPQCGCIKMSK